MNLLRLFQREFTGNLALFLAISILAGLSNAGVLAIINSAAEHAAETEASFRYLLMFLAAIGIYITAQRHTKVVSAKEVERNIHKIRTRIIHKIQSCDLSTIEGIGDSRIYASMTTETSTISQAAPMLVNTMQAAVLIFFTSLYIAYLSIAAFLLTVGFMTLAVSFHFYYLKKVKRAYALAVQDELGLFDRITDALNGFKEARMNSLRNSDLYNDATLISKQATENKVVAQVNVANHLIFSQSTFYLLLATMVFILPNFNDGYPDVVIKTATAVLFLIGPISTLVGSIPAFSTAGMAIDNINALEEELDKHAEEEAADMQTSQPIDTDFLAINFDNVCFSYPKQADGKAFEVGPFNLSFKRGEIVFIAGGNGSGKSTFMKLLTGLYYPTTGTINVDNTQITKSNGQQYRNLMSCVFTDYHLFKSAYGLKDVPIERIESLIDYLEMRGKVEYVDGEFSTIELSAGQKKRIALLVGLMEDRQIYIFDEWAADQDPEFRRKFYHEILPDLKKQNKTVIAVTHDDRYFDCADHLIRINEGKIESVTGEMNHV